MARVTPERLAQGQSEDAQQAALFCWLRAPETLAMFPQFPGLRYAHAIPNGGSRGDAFNARITGGLLKATGVLAGVLDIFIPVANHGYHGLYVEMKWGNNGMSDKQVEFADGVEKAGYCCVTCWSYAEAKAKILEYLNPVPPVKFF